ncbi:hypothetical protein RI367_006992 [Sorochytrium milnesiophthora]
MDWDYNPDYPLPPSLYAHDGSFNPVIQSLLDLSDELLAPHLGPSVKKRITAPPKASVTPSNSSTASIATDILARAVAHHWSTPAPAPAVTVNVHNAPATAAPVHEKRGKKKSRKRHDASSSSSSDDDDDDEDDDNNKKKKDAAQTSRALSTAVAVAASVGVAAFSAYKASQAAGVHLFSSHFDEDLVPDVRHRLQKARHWCTDREREETLLVLDSPDTANLRLVALQHARTDIHDLTQLLDALDRLRDTRTQSMWMLPAWIGGAAGGISFAASQMVSWSVTSPGAARSIAPFTSTAAGTMGLLSMTVALVYGFGVKGLYSSQLYRRPLGLYAQQGKAALTRLQTQRALKQYPAALIDSQ